MLREHHISHIVQVLDASWVPSSENDGFHRYRIEVMDQTTTDLLPHLDAVCTHIDQVLRSGRSVLVHCQQVSMLLLCLGTG